MPPTRFAPSHATPFKSTLSSSTQSRQHHQPPALSREHARPTMLKLSDLDPTQWSYLAEGGLNLLLRYTPHPASKPASAAPSPWQGKALRLRKSPRASSDASSSRGAESQRGTAAREDEVDEEAVFRDGVILPLLDDNASLLPQTSVVRIDDEKDRRTLETLAARVEIHRPRERRSSDGIDLGAARAWLVDDLCAAPSSAGSSAEVLTVEIKPKWGYLPDADALASVSSPNADLKTRFSRYRMHRIARSPDPSNITAEAWEACYDPLDLYSGEADRMRRAIAALWRDWNESAATTNNLRLFWKGNVVTPDQTEVLEEMAAFLARLPTRVDDGEAGDLPSRLASHLVAALSTPRLRTHTTGDDDKGDQESVLSRLAYLQSRLDRRDIEGLASDWQRLTSHPLGHVPPELAWLVAPATAVELADAVSPLDDDDKRCPETLEQLRRQTMRFLVASTWKDFSENGW
ncbi:hypothetical protein ACQY0O_001124 [Thecaphora frezii]